MTPQRVTLITLGVENIAQSRQFYQNIGWIAHQTSQEGIVFFQMSGLVLGLFGRSALAADQGRADATLGTGAMTLAINYQTVKAVDQAFATAVKAGAQPLKPPQKVFWGGYSGYFSDPDKHVWEIAMNPFWTLQEDGRLTLPDTNVRDQFTPAGCTNKPCTAAQRAYLRILAASTQASLTPIKRVGHDPYRRQQSLVNDPGDGPATRL